MDHIPDNIYESEPFLTDYSVTETAVDTMRRILGSVLKKGFGWKVAHIRRKFRPDSGIYILFW